MPRTPLISIPILLLIILLSTACNIFDFSGNKKKDNPAEKAEEYIRNGNYTKAKQVLSVAVKDSVNSEMLYLAAKATLLDGGFDIAQIVSRIRIEDPLPGLKLAILEFIDQFRDTKKTSWFASNIEVVVLLSWIWKEKATGMFFKDDIAIDYTIANMMTGILKIRDPNNDFKIDYRDFQPDLNFFQKTSGYLRSGFQISGSKIKDMSGDIVVNEQGLPEILKGLTAFLGGWDNLASGVKVDYKPDDINEWINSILVSLDNTNSCFNELKKNNLSFDIKEMKEYNNQIATSLNNFWYDDGIDNDGDGVIDEETINGIDDDNDGIIDEDSHYHKNDTTDVRNTNHINMWNTWTKRIK